MIQRDLKSEIKKYLHTKEIIAVLGPRQVGKTTILRELYKDLPNAKFITFDKLDVLRLFEDSIDEFIEIYVKGNRYLFIDEIQ